MSSYASSSNEPVTFQWLYFYSLGFSDSDDSEGMSNSTGSEDQVSDYYTMDFSWWT